MNGQQRSNGPSKDYSQINIVKQVKKFKDHKGYKLILYIRPFWDTHIGYLDNTFFGYKDVNHNTVLEPLEAIDYYLNKIPEIFRNPALEYDMFNGKEMYKPYLNTLNLVKDKEYARKKKKK